MSKIEKAVSWMLSIANNGACGYDQNNRWGPDYDCSSLVISAYQQAGIPVKTNGATYTGNMKSAFVKSGFDVITPEIQLATGKGLKRGDVLLNQVHHTAVYLGAGKLVHASLNEKGTITGGKSGDQTGGEICTRSYYNRPWDVILRYSAEQGSGVESEENDEYIVKSGDTLYSISKKYKCKVSELVEWNKIENPNVIYIGQIIRIKKKQTLVEGKFNVKVSISNLNIRTGAGLSYPIAFVCPVGVYTITQTRKADGHTWGKLLSGAGWIALEYATVL